VIAVIVVLILALAGATAWYFFRFRPQDAAAQKSPTHQNPVVSETAERVFSGGPGYVTSVSYSPDGKLLLSIGDEKSLILRDSETGAVVQTISDACCTINSAAISPDGSRLAVGMSAPEGRIRVLVWKDGKFAHSGQELVAKIRNPNVSVAFSSDGKQLLSRDLGHVVVWDLATGAEKRTFDAGPACAGLRSNGVIVTGGPGNDGQLWSDQSDDVQLTLTGHTNVIAAVAMSPDGLTAATGADDSTARLWDTRTGAAKGVMPHGEMNYVTTMAFSPSGTTLATGSSDTVQIWDVATGTKLKFFARKNLKSVAFSPDGRFLAAGGSEGNIYVWRIQ
jgi:WD40 repeat protein